MIEGKQCDAWGGCPLAQGHNRGNADIPEAHNAPLARRFSADRLLCRLEELAGAANEAELRWALGEWINELHQPHVEACGWCSSHVGGSGSCELSTCAAPGSPEVRMAQSCGDTD